MVAERIIMNFSLVVVVLVSDFNDSAVEDTNMPIVCHTYCDIAKPR